MACLIKFLVNGTATKDEIVVTGFTPPSCLRVRSSTPLGRSLENYENESINGSAYRFPGISASIIQEAKARFCLLIRSSTTFLVILVTEDAILQQSKYAS